MANAKNTQPAQAPEEAEIVIGSTVRFLGYPADTPEAEQILEADGEYEVVGLPGEVDGQETGYVLQVPNPDFNSKKKEHADTNPKFLETEVFPEEIELVVGEEEGEEDGDITYEELASYDKAELLEFAKVNEVKLTSADKKTDATLLAKLAAAFDLTPAESGEEEPEEPETPPAKPAAAKGKGKAAEAAPAGKGKAAEAKGKAAAAAPTGKGKAAAPAKGKAPEPEEETDPDHVPDLDNEDDAVLALIDGADDLLAVAQDLESSVAVSEYQLGGVLYHIKKNKLHLATDKKGKLLVPEYGEPGGFKKYLMDNLNIDYRKGTYLIDIYINFTQAGIENPSEVIARIGWTKASKISKPLALPEADIEGLIEAAEQNTVQDLSTIIKDQFTVGGSSSTTTSPGKKVNRITLRYRFVEEQANVVEDVLKGAADELGVKPEDALYTILTEWHAQRNAGGDEPEEPEQTARGSRKPAARKGRA